MSSGNTFITLADNGAATVVVPGASTQLVIGCSSAGTPYQIVATQRASTLQAVFGYGPLVEAGGLACVAGGTVLAMSVPVTTAGYASKPQTTGTGTALADVTVSFPVTALGAYDDYNVVLNILTAGIVGTAGITFQLSLDAGRNFGPTLSLGTATTYLIPNTNVQITMGSASDTYVLGDQITFSTKAMTWAQADVNTALMAFVASTYAGSGVGSMHLVGVAGVVDVNDIAGFPTSYLETLASSYFVYDRMFFSSRDSVGPAAFNAVPITGATAATPIVVHTTTPHGYNTGDTVTVSGVATLTAANGAWTITVTDDTHFSLNTSTGSGSPGTGGQAVSTSSTTLKDVKWVAYLQNAFSSVDAKRACVGAGYYNTPTVFPTTVAGAPSYRRSMTWSAAARQVIVPPQRHIGRVSDGSLSTISINPTSDPNDGFVYHDESINGGLDYIFSGIGTTKFMACTTRKPNLPGFYVTNPLLASPGGSAFTLMPYGTVMDVACDIVHQVGQLQINSDVRLTGGGTLYVNDALSLQNSIQTALQNQMTGAGMITGSTVVVDQTNNVRATGIVNIQVTINAKGYILSENVTIGFLNQNANT